MSSISVLTAGLKNTEHREARKAASRTTGTLRRSENASAPMPSMIAPRTMSMPTMTPLRLHLSITVPLKGDRNMTTNIEIDDMTPISVLEPVFSKTQ